jgi:hypothetical protein
MLRCLGLLIAASVATSSIGIAQTLSAKAIAVCGYATGAVFLDNILPAGQLASEDRIAAPPAVADYPRYSSIIWNDLIKDPAQLGIDVAWDLQSNADAVRAFLQEGGILLVTGVAIPVSSSKVLRKLGPLSELFGITGITKAKPQGKIKILDPKDPLFSGLEINPAGYEWVANGSALAEAATTAKVLAVATASDGRELPFITVQPLGKGRLYWFGAVPARLRKSEAPLQDKQFFEKILVRALGGETSGTQPAGSVPFGSSSKVPMKGPNGWGREPLGQDLQPPPKAQVSPAGRPTKTAWRKEESAPGEPTVLISGGTPRAFLVLAESPSEAAREAAELLRHSLQEASGADLPIVSEIQVRKDETGGLHTEKHPELTVAIVVGETQIGADLGVRSAGLPEEGFLIETRGPLMFIVGRDRSEKGVKTFGTLFGAVDFLEKQGGFRWLWPGVDGTVIPKFSTLGIPAGKVIDAPSLVLRRLRNYNVVRRITAGLETLGIPYKDHEAKWQPTANWFKMMRTGSSQNLNAGHAFAGWYEKYHANHPDWFGLQPDGTRTQVAERETLCTSNDGVVDAAAKQILGNFTADPTLSAASASPNDGGQNDVCMCEACRSLDPPGAPPISMRLRLNKNSYFVPYVSLSDRILSFYNRVAEKVVAKRPDALIAAQAYSYYRSAPLQTPVHPSLVIYFVGLSFLELPRHEADQLNWDRWAALSDRIILRPNTLHTGHAFPAVFTSEAGRCLAHCYTSGMMGADFDSIIHHWATQGLNYYVLAKLLWNPQADPKALVDDYCKTGFGAAAEDIRNYFSEIENITGQVASKAAATVESGLRGEEDDMNARSRDALIDEFSKVYAGEAITRLRGILAHATTQAAGDEAVLRRIRFLSTGLDYAEVQSRFYVALAKGDGSKALGDRQEAMKKFFWNDFLAVNVGYILWKELSFLQTLGGGKTR